MSKRSPEENLRQFFDNLKRGKICDQRDIKKWKEEYKKLTKHLSENQKEYKRLVGEQKGRNHGKRSEPDSLLLLTNHVHINKLLESRSVGRNTEAAERELTSISNQISQLKEAIQELTTVAPGGEASPMDVDVSQEAKKMVGSQPKVIFDSFFDHLKTSQSPDSNLMSQCKAEYKRLQQSSNRLYTDYINLLNAHNKGKPKELRIKEMVAPLSSAPCIEGLLKSPSFKTGHIEMAEKEFSEIQTGISLLEGHIEKLQKGDSPMEVDVSQDTQDFVHLHGLLERLRRNEDYGGEQMRQRALKDLDEIKRRTSDLKDQLVENCQLRQMGGKSPRTTTNKKGLSADNLVQLLEVYLPQHKSSNTQLLFDAQREYDNAIKEIEEIQNKLKKIQQENNSYSLKNDRIQSPVVAQQKTIESLQADLRQLKKEKEQAENQRDAFRHQLLTPPPQKTIENLQADLRQLKKEKEQAENQRDTFRRQLMNSPVPGGDRPKNKKSAKDQEKVLQKFQEAIDELSTENTHLRKAVGEQTEVNKKLRQELDSMTSRFSAVAKDKLTRNNPAIADLSDPHRPTKLAEEFSELYNNEWTNAFEAIQGKKKAGKEKKGKQTSVIPESKIIAHLLEILKVSDRFCQKLTEKQEEDIENIIKDPREVLPSRDKKDEGKSLEVTIASSDVRTLFSELTASVVTLRKCIAADESVIGCLYEAFLTSSSSKLPEDLKILDGGDVQKYLKGCLKLTWLMAVQDPPMYLHFDVQKGTPFDGKKFKAYTQSGKTMDFLVWPVLCLQRPTGDNEMIIASKGIAQPL